ncbi:LPD23 domain-containing protein [Dysosmobacter welbionis]|uniref:LPD23 domain-containing protein n=2 Tax=Dysosmobacter welbionis TaxID=2093857 RepID=UPI002943410F|nr:LPD23 domain-containing protein [Dysosmobacter welbionis]
MGKLKRISEGKRTQAGTGGGHFRRIDTGEIITYNPDPVRSMPRVDKITGGGRTASPSLPTVSGTKGTQTDESRADAIREALVRLDAIEQTRAAAPRLTAEGLEREALEEIGREFGLDAQQTRTAYTARKALEEDLDRITNPRRKAGRAERGGKIEGAYSFGKSVEGAVVKGLEQVARFGGDTFALAEDIALAPFELLSGNDLGTFSDKGLFNWWAADIRKEQEAVEKHYAPNAARGGKAAQIFEDLGASTVAALPQAVLALLTGGGSAAAQTTAGLTGTAAQAVSPGVAATVQGAVRSMAKNPQYWTSFAQVVGSSYEDALDDMIELEAQKEMTAALIGETYEPPENQNAMRAKAALYAIGNGLMNAAVEIGGGIQTLPDQLRGGQSAWKSWVEAMVDEGKEEVVQGVIERALQNPMYGAGNPLFSTTDERAIFNPATAAQEFAGGAVVGGVLGGGQIGATRGINAAARRAAEAQARRQAETASPLPSGNRQAQGPQITQAVPAGTQNAAPEGAAVTVRKGSSALESGKGLARTLAGSIDSIRDMQPVAELTGREMNNRAKKPSEQIRDFFKRIGGTVTRSGFGAVSLGEYGVGGMLNHRPLNRAKMVSITAVPEVIQEGRQIAFDPNWKGRGYASYVFAAPVTIAGTQTYVAAVVDQRPDNKFYLSEVVDSEGNYIRIEESPSGDTKSGVTVRDGVTTTPERDSADLKESPSLDTGKAPAAAEVQSRPVEGTRPLNSDSTIAPGAEIVNRGEETRQPAAVNVAELEQSAAAAGVAEADVRAAEEISRALGREIRFYDGAQRQGPSGRANGYFDGDTIYVNSRSANPVAQIISHELTHSVEMADAYRDLSSLVFDRIQKDGGDLSQLRQEKQNLYAQNGKVLRSQEEVDREIVAEYVEHNLLTNEQEILDLTRENPTLGQRILDWINRILARLGNTNARERAFLTDARNTYARALEQTRTSQETGQRQSAQQPPAPAAQTAPAGQQTERQAEPQARERGAEPQQTDPARSEQRQRSREEIRQEVRALREDLLAGRISDEEFDEALDAIMEEEGLEDISMLNRYSFGGENARRADLEALDRAQDMERRGVAMETIFQETGWYTGADGKWRFEIDDSGMEYSRWGDMNRSDRAEYARFRELEGRFIDGTITQEEQAELRQLLDQGHGPGRAEEQQTLRLADFLRHDELYQNYPQLRQATLRFADLPEGTHGSYNTGTNTITLNNSLRDAPEDTLVHEIQHAIQSAEGFSGGSSPEYWARREYETGDLVSNRLQQEYDQILNGLGREDQNKYIRYTELERELEHLFLSDPNTEAGRRYDRLEAEQDAIYEELYPNAWFRQLLDLNRRMEDTAGEYRRMYENTAGEIEARDVTARRQLTPEQRRRTMPNTGDSYSMQEPDAAAQDEAERLLFQGVDADTIREMTGLERTEDHGWRFAVDTAQAAAYDGGRTTDQQGGADNGQDTTLRGIYGEDVRGREAEETNPGRLGSAQRRNAASSQTDEGRGRTAPASWARGRVIDQPSIAAGIAVENAGRYGADAFVVEDAAIKEKNPNAWALTSGGSVYISDSVPEELAGVVGYHEAVHAARQQGQAQYRDFLENTGDYIDFTSNQSAEIMDMILGRRFPGRESLLDLTQREQDIAFDELNALVWGYHKADPENARAQFADMFQDYDAYIADLDAAMESGAEPEIPGLSLPTLDDEDIRYSMDEDSAAAPDDSANQTEQSREESAVAALPPRAQNYLKSVERKLLRKMGNSLSVPRWARREFLAPIVRDISEAYLVEGRVPAETMDNLFDEAYEQGVVAAREYYDEYKELRDYLRNTKLEVSQEDAAGIPDFNDFRKSNFGRLNISTKSGKTNVDQVYQELSARWPEFFNEDRENNIPDQLERIAEVSKSFRIVEQTLDEYYGDRAADFRQYAKHDFEAAVTDLLGELRNVKRYADASRQPAEAADQAPATLEEVNALWTDLKEARRTYEKAEARNLLTDSDEAQVGRLLRGEIEPQHLNPERDNVRGITEVYQAKREYERITGLLRLWNQSRKAEMRTQAEHLLETANAWKDKKSGILYARETMERNIRDIVPDRQLAEQIIETYFKPVHRAAADSNRLKNRYRDQVRGMHLSRKVAKGNTVSEAHAVQLLGEAEDNIRMIQQSRGRRKVRDGKTLEEWQAVIRDLWETSPHLDQGKIRNAVQTFRTIYDELFQQMNDARVRNGYEPVNYRQGYFPHFQPGDGDGILATFGRALGISTEVTALPTTINGLTHAFRPGIQWFGNAQERLGFNTAYDAVEGFDRYIEGVADVIYQTDNIQRLRTLATEIRYRTGDEGIRRQIDRVRDDPGKNDEEKRKAIEEITEKGRFALSNFVVELDEYTNLLANKKSFSDRNMERNVGRTRLYNLARWLEGRVAANMVAVNPASWLTNFIPLTQGGALLDRGMLLRGMWDTLWSYKESDGIAERSSFLVNRRGSDPLVQTWGQKASVVMSRPMSYIDTFTADSLVRARYRQNLKRGMSEDAAMADADAFAANVMADRSKGATPTLFNRRNPMTKLFTQFQLEVNNQLSYVFKDIPREKRRAGLGALAAALFKFVLGAWLYDEVYEFLIGRRPALDPIGILNDTVGDLTGWEVPNLVELGVGAVIGDAPSWQVEEAGLYETAGNLGTALAEELPFIGGLLGGGRLPIGSAIPDFGTLRRAAMDNEWAPEKRLKEAADELAKPAAYLALPFGGGQIKRVFEAIDAVRRGGVYTLDAEGEEQLQYPVYNDTFWEAVANGLRAAVFGRTSLPTGREWVESGFDTLSAKQTAAYKGMVDVGVPGEEAYSLVQELQGLKAAEQRKTLRSADISGDGKSVVYYAMMASDDEMALMDALAGQNADMGEVTRVLMEMKDEARKEENKRSTVDILSGASLTDGQKAEIFRSTGSDSLEEKLSVAEEYGISGGEWMEAEEGFAQEREEAEAKSLTQEIAEAVIRNMDGLDRQERAAMWQLQNKGWNWKSNPFDRKVGREIYDQQHAEDED